MTVTIDVIGGVRAFVDGEPVKLRRQVQRILAILVAAGPPGIEASALAEELWVGGPPARWDSAIRNALTSLRSKIGPDAVRTEGGRYGLSCEIENVDAWRILDADALSGVRTTRIGVDRYQPFNGLELTPLLRETTAALHGARVALIERMSVDDGADPAVLSGLVASVRADPFAEPMALAVINLLIRFGDTAKALDLITTIEASYRTELGAEPPLALKRARQLAKGTIETGPIARPIQVPPPLPSIVGELVQRPMTRRHAKLAELTAEHIAGSNPSKRWSILGLAGSGKSRFAAEIGNRLHHAGTDVIFAIAVGDESAAYSPFLTASPEFRRRFQTLDAQNESAVWALWSSIIEHRGVTGRPVVLIVDDAHLLDRPSIRLLQFMHRMEPSTSVTTLIVGRSSTTEEDWRPFERELLDDDRTSTVDVPPLDVNDVAALIASNWPQASGLVHQDAAVEVTAASGGLPMVTHLLVDSLKGPTLGLPPQRRSHHIDMAADRLQTFDEQTQQVLAAATLVSSPFEANDLQAVLDLDTETVDAKLDLAARAAVLSDTEEPGRYRFVHDLLRQAAVGLVPRETRAEWSRRLMKTTDDPLRLARLALAAKESIEPAEVARLASNGARAALDRSLFRRSVELAQEALNIGADSDTDHEALACLAIGQVKLGAFNEAAATRDGLLDRTRSSADHQRATRTLLDSLPYVEIDHPTSVWVADFDRLETAGHDLEVERAIRLARLAVNEGNRDRCDRELSIARSLYRTDVEAAQIFHAEWACEAQTFDDAWFERLSQLREAVTGHQIAELLAQIESLELASLGRWNQAEQSNAAFFQLAVDHSSAESQWQSMLASSGFAFAQGEIEAAARIADEAFEFGMLYALPFAPAARAAQAFVSALYGGDIGGWLSFIEAVSPDLLRNTLAMAAVGRARFEVGRVDDAWEMAEQILPTVLDREHRIAVSVVAVLAPVIRKRAAPSLRLRCADLLRAADDRWVITGAGFAVHGPAKRALAIIEGDRRSLQRLRHELAGTPIWVDALDADIARVDSER